jgi:protein subunit release factor B
MPLRWKRELLALLTECEVTPYRSSGPGGQKKNKTESAIRIRHIPTGIVRIATESRSQSANKLRALERIREAIEERTRRAKPRIPSRRTNSSREERLTEKKRRGTVKERRGRVSTDSGD